MEKGARSPESSSAFLSECQRVIDAEYLALICNPDHIIS